MKLDAILTPSAHVKGRLALYNRLTAADKEEILDLVAIKDSRTGALCNMTDSTGARLRDVAIYGKSTQDGTPADAHVDIVSVGEDGSTDVVVCGRNLISSIKKSSTLGGVSFDVNDDGTITANGTATSALVFRVAYVAVLAGTTYTLTGCPSGGSVSTYNMYMSNSGIYFHDYGNGKTFQVTADNRNTSIYINVAAGASLTNLVFKPQLEVGSTATEYEPYRANTATITSNLPLRGIKVSSGGNYTDASGQQWICDSIEKYADGTGKYVQRIEEITLDGSEQWINAAASTRSYFTCRIGDLGTAVLGVGMCTHFERTTITSATTTIGFDVNESTSLKRTQIAIRPNLENIPDVGTFTAWLAENSTTVIYALAEPIETPLTAEEVTEFEKLYSFFPLTNVYNSDGADMAVTYICDTKTYIDNRLEELQTAVAALV